MQNDSRLKEVEVQIVWVHNVGRFEVADGAIIRCRRGIDQTAMKSTAWTKEEEELISHLVRTGTTQGTQEERVWQGKNFKVQVGRPRRCWVLRRKDGTVYQIHPGYASAFARQKFQELTMQEG